MFYKLTFKHAPAMGYGLSKTCSRYGIQVVQNMLPLWDTGCPKHSPAMGYGFSKKYSRYGIRVVQNMFPLWDTGCLKHASTSGYGLSKTCSRYWLWDTGCLKNRTQIFCTKIVQRFSYVSSKNCMKFRYNFASRRESYFAQILKKILVFAFFVVSFYFALSTYFFISSYFVKFREPILRNE